MFTKQLKKSILALSILGLMCPLESMCMMQEQKSFHQFDVKDATHRIFKALLYPLTIAHNWMSKEQSTLKRPQDAFSTQQTMVACSGTPGEPGGNGLGSLVAFTAGLIANASTNNNNQRIKNNLLPLGIGALLLLASIPNLYNAKNNHGKTLLALASSYLIGSGLGIAARMISDRQSRSNNKQQVDDETADLLVPQAINNNDQ